MHLSVGACSSLIVKEFPLWIAIDKCISTRLNDIRTCQSQLGMLITLAGFWLAAQVQLAIRVVQDFTLEIRGQEHEAFRTCRARAATRGVEK